LPASRTSAMAITTASSAHISHFIGAPCRSLARCTIRCCMTTLRRDDPPVSCGPGSRTTGELHLGLPSAKTFLAGGPQETVRCAGITKGEIYVWVITDPICTFGHISVTEAGYGRLVWLPGGLRCLRGGGTRPAAIERLVHSLENGPAPVITNATTGAGHAISGGGAMRALGSAPAAVQRRVSRPWPRPSAGCGRR
jgi:hypothetical protein